MSCVDCSIVILHVAGCALLLFSRWCWSSIGLVQQAGGLCVVLEAAPIWSPVVRVCQRTGGGGCQAGVQGPTQAANLLSFDGLAWHCWWSCV